MSTFDLAEMMEYPLEIVERVINRGEAMSKEFIIALSFVKMKGAFQSYDFWTERNKKYVKWLEKQEDDSKP
jgi:plasmid maintenance system antidote protein VapI